MADQSKPQNPNPSGVNPPPRNVLQNPQGQTGASNAPKAPESPAGSPPKPAVTSNESRDGPASISAGVANSRTAKDEEGAGGVNVTYRPGPEDPSVTVWNGHTFHANRPLRVKHTGMLAQARTNSFFEVEGQDDSKKFGSKSSDDVPTDSEGYRRHAIEWFKAARSSTQMKARWDGEESLRQSCGVGSDDLEYLDKLYGPRHAELTKAES